MKRITLSSKPKVCGGEWCIDGTRIPFMRFMFVVKEYGWKKTIEEHYPQLKSMLNSKAKTNLTGGEKRNK